MDEAKPKSNLKWIVAGCGGCVVVGGGLLALLISSVLVMTKAPFEAAHAHVRAVKEGRVDEAYQATSAGFRAAADREAFGAFVEQWQVLYAPTAEFTVKQRQVLNDGATISGTARNGQAEATVVIQLVRDGDVWRVHGVNLELTQGSASPAAEGGGGE